jgi:hypothetical protein
MVADLFKGKRSVFSLDAPPVPVSDIVLAPNIVIPADKIITGTVVGTPSVPQTQTDEDDELAAIAELDEPVAPPPPKAAPLYEVAPEVPDATKPPKVWRKPTGRLVGTKEPVWIQTEEPEKTKEDPTERPDHTGFIKEAAFLEAE